MFKLNKQYSFLVVLIVAVCSLIIIGFNYLVDTQFVVHQKTDTDLQDYASLLRKSEYGMYYPPVHPSLLSYVVIDSGTIDCVLHGSSNIAPASAEEMPSIFGDCENFWNGWVTGGGPFAAEIFSDIAIKNDVKKFVYEIHPFWYNFNNFEFWSQQTVIDKSSLKSLASNEKIIPLFPKLSRLSELTSSLLNLKYFVTNFDYIAKHEYKLPIRSSGAGVDGKAVKYITSKYQRMEKENLLRRDGAMTFAEIYAYRPSKGGARPCTDRFIQTQFVSKWGWIAIKNTLSKLVRSGIDTRVLLIPTHSVVFEYCPRFRREFRVFQTKLKKITDNLGVQIHGSFFSEDLGNPMEIDKYLIADGHHIGQRQGFSFIR